MYLLKYLSNYVLSLLLISSHCCSLGTYLGSGQFGEVFKGVWVSPNSSVDAAIKTLKEDATTEDKIRFLQEAAIMGQFKHPNVVTMYGVVVNDNKVSLIKEYSIN